MTVASTAPGWETAPIRHFSMEVIERPVYANQWGYDFVVEFIRAIRQGGQTTVSIDFALSVMQIIDAAYESSRTVRRIELTD